MSKGTCPVCNGTTRRPCPDNLRKYGLSNGWYGYDKADDTVECRNCGAQYMMGRPTGKVNCRPDGTPCTHDYDVVTVSNCYHKHTCKHCGEVHHIDSGD